MNKPKSQPQDDRPFDTPENLSKKNVDETGPPSDTERDADTDKAREMSLIEQLEAAVAERDANRDSWLRTQAELENYRKRAQREAEEQRQYQALPLSRDLLPGLDNLRRALLAAEKSRNVEELVEGVRLVSKQMEDALARHGVKPIEAEGKPFDPNLHQALQQVPSAEHPPLTVLNELERGYVLKDRVVRPSSVIVSQAPQSEADAAREEQDIRRHRGEPKSG